MVFDVIFLCLSFWIFVLFIKACINKKLALPASSKRLLWLLVVLLVASNAVNLALPHLIPHHFQWIPHAVMGTVYLALYFVIRRK